MATNTKTDLDDLPGNLSGNLSGTGALTEASNGKAVKVRVTKLGGGKVSTGRHVAVEGEVMAKAGDILAVPQAVADALEARGLAEIQ